MTILQGGGQAEGDERDPDGADGQAVIQEGAVAGEIGVAVVVGEAGQVQGLSDADEDVAAVMVVAVVVMMMVGMCHLARPA